MRRSGDEGARSEVVRAAARGRLRQDPGWKNVSLSVTRVASRTPALERRNSIPAKAGLGLRFPHHQAVLDERPDVAWLEVPTENYLGGGSPQAYLDSIRRDYPISLHEVGLSLGSAEGLDLGHLARIRRVAKRFQPGVVSEHLSWSVVGGTYAPVWLLIQRLSTALT